MATWVPELSIRRQSFGVAAHDCFGEPDVVSLAMPMATLRRPAAGSSQVAGAGGIQLCVRGSFSADALGGAAPRRGPAGLPQLPLARRYPDQPSVGMIATLSICIQVSSQFGGQMPPNTTMLVLLPLLKFTVSCVYDGRLSYSS